MLGLCDVIIATRGANIGMGGPAMIEGGGLGKFKPSEIGPLSVQVPELAAWLMLIVGIFRCRMAWWTLWCLMRRLGCK